MMYLLDSMLLFQRQVLQQSKGLGCVAAGRCNGNLFNRPRLSLPTGCSFSTGYDSCNSSLKL